MNHHFIFHPFSSNQIYNSYSVQTMISFTQRLSVVCGLIRSCCFYRCSHLSAEWEVLEEACGRRAAHLSKAITREQVRDINDHGCRRLENRCTGSVLT